LARQGVPLIYMALMSRINVRLKFTRSEIPDSDRIFPHNSGCRVPLVPILGPGIPRSIRQIHPLRDPGSRLFIPTQIRVPQVPILGPGKPRRFGYKFTGSEIRGPDCSFPYKSGCWVPGAPGLDSETGDTTLQTHDTSKTVQPPALPTEPTPDSAPTHPPAPQPACRPSAADSSYPATESVV
jgi:hypothetical protein